MKFILGTKLGMTQVFREDGTVVPVTRVKAGPCVVTQVKTGKGNSVQAVQIGFGEQKAYRLPKAQQGHLKDLTTVRYMRDFRTDGDEGVKRGDTFTVKIFEAGEKVQVVGTSKGKGFQGVVKRHHFAGSPATHGHKDQLRMPGSIGSGGVQRVFKGTRMGGRMGDSRVTVKNLEVVEIHENENELLIKGAIPGARGGLLLISTPDGKIEIAEEKVEEVAGEETTTEETVEKNVEETASEAVESTEAPVEEVSAEAETPAEDAKEEETK